MVYFPRPDVLGRDFLWCIRLIFGFFPWAIFLSVVVFIVKVAACKARETAVFVISEGLLYGVCCGYFRRLVSSLPSSPRVSVQNLSLSSILITTDPGLQHSRMTTKQQKHPRTLWATSLSDDGKTEPISPYQNSTSVHQEQITKV